MKRFITPSALLVLLCLGAEPLRADMIIFDPAADFSLSGNPNGVWQYGWSASTPTTALTLFDHPFQIGDVQFWNDANHQAFGVPVVYKNTGEGYITNVDAPAGALLLHGGIFSPSDYSHVVFTAPQAGEYQLDALFTVRQFDPLPNNANVQVLWNSMTVFTMDLQNYLSNTSYSHEFLLSAGDTLDFAVGFPGLAADGGNTTQLQATITLQTAVPEPSSLILLGTGSLVLLGWRWPRRKTDAAG